MNPVEFENTIQFLEYFEKNATLALGPTKPLVIKNIDPILVAGILINEIASSPNIVYAQYFLNRIVLPLGIALDNETPGNPSIHIIGNEVKFTNDKETKLVAKKGPILTTIHDLVIRLMQTGKHSFTMQKDEKIFIAGLSVDQVSMFQRTRGEIAPLVRRYPSLGYDIELDYGVSGTTLSCGGIQVMDLTLTRDFKLNLFRRFDFSNPSDLGKVISLMGKFTLPAGKTLTVENVRDHTFLPKDGSETNVGDLLLTFFHRCLACYGLKVDTLSYGGNCTWKFQDNEHMDNVFTYSSTNDLEITAKKSDGALLELASLAWDMRDLDVSERKVTIGPGQRLVFSLKDIAEEKIRRIDRYFSPENIQVDEKGLRLGHHIFDSPDIVGLSWSLTATQVQFGKGVHQKFGVPVVFVETEEQLTLELVPSNPAQFIVDILNDAPEGTREAFLESDPQIYRYILFQMFMRILGGVLSDYPTKDLEGLDLREDVLGEIERLRKDEHFDKCIELVIKKHSVEINEVCHLGMVDLDAISVDHYSAPVQAIIKKAIALVGTELQGSAILTTHCQTAMEILEK